MKIDCSRNVEQLTGIVIALICCPACWFGHVILPCLTFSASSNSLYYWMRTIAHTEFVLMKFWYKIESSPISVDRGSDEPTVFLRRRLRPLQVLINARCVTWRGSPGSAWRQDFRCLSRQILKISTIWTAATTHSGSVVSCRAQPFLWIRPTFRTALLLLCNPLDVIRRCFLQLLSASTAMLSLENWRRIQNPQCCMHKCFYQSRLGVFFLLLDHLPAVKRLQPIDTRWAMRKHLTNILSIAFCSIPMYFTCLMVDVSSERKRPLCFRLKAILATVFSLFR